MVDTHSTDPAVQVNADFLALMLSLLSSSHNMSCTSLAKAGEASNVETADVDAGDDPEPPPRAGLFSGHFGSAAAGDRRRLEVAELGAPASCVAAFEAGPS